MAKTEEEMKAITAQYVEDLKIAFGGALRSGMPFDVMCSFTVQALLGSALGATRSKQLARDVMLHVMNDAVRRMKDVPDE